jgi:hypothetical protein
MVRKKRQTTMPVNELYILPSPNDEMRKFVTKFKVDMMEHVVSSIKFAVENKLPIVEVFQFKDSPFVVTINEKEFMPNLSHIRKYYMDHELYELCPKVEKLCETLTKNPDEKEKQEPDGSNNPNS